MSVVVITGCSSGFGLQIALAFARRGDAVVATMRDLARREALEFALSQERLSAEILQLDVTDGQSISQLVRTVQERHGGVDVLVNNAGIGAIAALEDLPEETLRQVFESNFFGAINLTRAALPGMRQQGRGRIVFMNAIGGLLNTPYLGAYTASKHALDCIAATWDIELRPFGIRVSSVLPAAFQTGMSGNLITNFGSGSPYAAAAAEYHRGLVSRMAAGSSDLSPVVQAVIEAATAEDPALRYLVAPHLAEVLDPLVAKLDQLHRRELASAPKG